MTGDLYRSRGTRRGWINCQPILAMRWSVLPVNLPTERHAYEFTNALPAADAGLVFDPGIYFSRADHPDPVAHPALRLHAARRRARGCDVVAVRLADRQLFQHPHHRAARKVRDVGRDRRLLRHALCGPLG